MWYQCQLSIFISVTFGSCISFFTSKSFIALEDKSIYPVGMYDECIFECCRNSKTLKFGSGLQFVYNLYFLHDSSAHSWCSCLA